MADSVEKHDLEKDGELEPTHTIRQGEAPVYLKHANHNDADEAMKAFVDGEMIVMTPEMERKLLRKIDLNLMPVSKLIEQKLISEVHPS